MDATARYSQVLLASWRQRDRSSPWGRRLIAALLVVTGLACAFWLPPAAAWRAPVGLLLAVLLGLWLALAASLLEQNHPHAARGVPGHVRTLRRAALLGWALCTALCTLLMWVMLPRQGLEAVLLLASGFTAVFLLWATRLPWLWVLFGVLFPLSGAFKPQLVALWQALGALWSAHTAALLALGLVAQAWLVTCAFDDGGARHQARYARHAQMRNAMRMQADGKPLVIAWGPLEWLGRPFASGTATWLQHVLRRADNRHPRSVMARAEIVLHGSQHWVRHAMTMGAIAATVVIAFSLVIARTQASLADLLTHGAFGMAIGIASAGLSPYLALSSLLWQSRREQALLRLLPGMPQGRALNVAVARLQWRDFSVSWLLTAAALLALGRVAGHSLLCLPLAALPVAAFMLTRRPALLRAPTPIVNAGPGFVFLLLAGVLYVLQRELGLPLAWQAVVTVGPAAALLAWRWPRLAAAPMALPAGRLAG